MFVAESVLSNMHISNAMTGIQLVNSSLLVRNCRMDVSAGIQLSGSTPLSLTLDGAILNTRFGSSIDANLLSGLDVSVMNSSFTTYDRAAKVRCRDNLNLRIVNSTMRSLRGEVIDIGGNATRMTFTAETSNFIGRVQMDDFNSDFQQQLVRSFK